MSVFLVRRKAARSCPRDDIPDPTGQYTATFTTRDAAEAFARQLDRADKRARAPTDFLDTFDDPFRAAEWGTISTLPPPILRDWLRDEDIEPPAELKLPTTRRERRNPPDELTAWRTWWADVVRRNDLTAGQWERVWLGLNRHCLFEVVEVEPDAALSGLNDEPDKPATVFAVVRIDWEYTDNWFDGENAAIEAFRTRDAAERRRTALERAGPSDDRNYGPFVFVVIELPLDEYAG